MVLRAVVVDDETAQRSILKRKIGESFPERIAIVGEAFSVDTAIAVINEQNPDIVFLDIELIGGTGFDVLDAFEEIDFEVIFVTSYPEFGAKAFRYEAIDYILKPVEPQDLKDAVERVFKARYAGSNGQITSNYLSARMREGGVVAIETQSIVYCEAFNGYVKVALEDNTSYLIQNTLSECAESLQKVGGIEIERGTVINCAYCIGWEPNGRGAVAIMKNGERFSVSKRMKPTFVAIMSRKLGILGA
ncbi:MAG: response regulator transcription factor [Candidatus Kapabacteria bacterium]|jgi:two-component system LytT family response regulator|nr:response regulator transcription factor [Candidatus Kapabacteria bacterium]